MSLEKIIDRSMALETCVCLILGELYLNHPEIYEKIKSRMIDLKNQNIIIGEGGPLPLITNEMLHVFNTICMALEKKEKHESTRN